MNQEEDIIYGLVAWKKHKWRSGYTKYERIVIDGSDAPTIKIHWIKGFDKKVLTFNQGDVKEISYKENSGGWRGVAEWKITGKVTIEKKPTIPEKTETITFKFREKDNRYFGDNFKLEYWRKLITGKDSEDPSEFSGRKTVAHDPATDEKLVGGKRRKTRKQRKSRKGGKKSRKQRKSRKSGKKSHKRRTRKRRTR
tara:strand:- start:245 stop:832 length:588 start_codon:yes stop_codon:yes gene_type:complete